MLKGVNDDIETLMALTELGRCQIKPYYLHHADLGLGTAHLRTSIVTGQRLAKELRRRASGLCKPAYMLDIPGGAAKSDRVEPCTLVGGRRRARVQSDDGAWRPYPPQ